jgi:soluble lytic murein transglycosylase-like protein
MHILRLTGACCALAASLILCCRSVSAAAPPAVIFLHALHALGAPADAASLLPSAQENPSAYLGHVFEISASVNGLMNFDGQVSALLSGSPQGALTVRVPASLAGASWLSDTGGRLRALIRIDQIGNDQSLSSITLLAAAPEADIDQVEQAETARVQAARTQTEWRESRNAPVLASRSLTGPRGSSRPWNSEEDGAEGEYQPVTTLSPAALRVLPAYREAIHRLNTRLPDGLLTTITANILGFSQQYGVDPRLVIAMMIAESGFDINSTSSTGAMGLGQLMPETARGLGVTNAYDPVQNIQASVRLLSGHLAQYGGQLSLTMAAYNAGPGAVRKYHGVPPYRETQHYVAKVASLYRQLCGK